MKLQEYRQLPNNLFGLLFWNIFFTYLAIFIVVGLLALFGLQPIEFNDEPTYGITGLITSLILAPVMSFVTALSTWIFLKLGNFLLRLFVK